MPINPERINDIKVDLRRMFDEDQSMQKPGSIWDEAVHVGHITELKRIIEELGGWPTIPLVGDFASMAAWFLVQHDDRDVAFQKECLAVMLNVPEGEINRRNIAYLDDRIAVAEKKPQKYGTQFYKDESGEMSPRPIVDLEHIDEVRASMDLEPFEEYRKQMLEAYPKKSS